MGSYSISVGYGKTTIYHVPYFYFCRALTAFVVVLSFSLSSALFFSVDDVPFFFSFFKNFSFVQLFIGYLSIYLSIFGARDRNMSRNLR